MEGVKACVWLSAVGVKVYGCVEGEGVWLLSLLGGRRNDLFRNGLF